MTNSGSPRGNALVHRSYTTMPHTKPELRFRGHILGFYAALRLWLRARMLWLWLRTVHIPPHSRSRIRTIVITAPFYQRCNFMAAVQRRKRVWNCSRHMSSRASVEADNQLCNVRVIELDIWTARSRCWWHNVGPAAESRLRYEFYRWIATCAGREAAGTGQSRVTRCRWRRLPSADPTRPDHVPHTHQQQRRSFGDRTV